MSESNPQSAPATSTSNNPRPRRRNRKPRSANGTNSANGANGTDGSGTDQAKNTSNGKSGESGSSERKDSGRPPRRRPMARPKPKDPRKSEIYQLRKGYPNLVASDDETLFAIALTPSDPDFPFDIASLNFDLYVPKDYPASAPSIMVKNTDIPRGYAVNVELGFKNMAIEKLGKLTLMNLTLTLDKHLEEFLRQERKETIRIVKHKPKPAPQATTASTGNNKASNNAGEQTKSKPSLRYDPKATAKFVPNYLKDERSLQIDLMRARLKSVKLFSDSAEGSTFSVTIDPPSSQLLPPELCVTFNVLLHVPADYGLSGATITIPIDDVSARNIETNFNTHANAVKGKWTLLSLLNYLTTQLEQLMLPVYTGKPVVEDTPKTDREVKGKEPVRETVGLQKEDQEPEEDDSTGANGTNGANDSDQDSEEENSEEKSSDQADDAKGADQYLPPPLIPRGIAVMIPGLKITNVGFLECQTLNLVVRCSRCKSTNDLLHLSSAPYGKESKPQGVSCYKCKQTLSGAFRKDILHASNERVGFLDLMNCTPFHILPNCSFIPTCDNCSTTLASPFKRMQVAQNLNANCLECHTKMSLFIPEVRFDEVGPQDTDAPGLKLKVRPPKKESLGITGGTPLPNDGTCEHYKKSTRWFRFSCCGKVFACDRCHDQASDHPTEPAHRMICGKCSREQNFTDTCVFCRHSFAVRHSAFWEGGKGTRDQTRMSRKDPRKYKRTRK